MASPVTEERGSPFPARTVGPGTGTTRMSQAVGALRAASEGGRPRVAPRCWSGGERGVEPAPWPPRRAAPGAAPPAPHGPRPAPPVHLDLSCCPRPGAVAPAPGSRCGPSPATRSRPAGQWDAHSGLDEAPSTWGTPLARGVGNLWGPQLLPAQSQAPRCCGSRGQTPPARGAARGPTTDAPQWGQHRGLWQGGGPDRSTEGQVQGAVWHPEHRAGAKCPCGVAVTGGDPKALDFHKQPPSLSHSWVHETTAAAKGTWPRQSALRRGLGEVRPALEMERGRFCPGPSPRPREPLDLGLPPAPCGRQAQVRTAALRQRGTCWPSGGDEQSTAQAGPVQPCPGGSPTLSLG